MIEDVKNNIAKEGNLLVLGNGWSSDISYYSERKSLTSPLNEGQLTKLLIKDEYMQKEIKGIVVNHQYNNISESTLQKLIELYNLSLEPIEYYGQVNYSFYHKKTHE